MPLVKVESHEQFDELIKRDRCVVDFSATWCAPCKKLLSNMDKVFEYCDDITVAKVDVNELDDIAEAFNVNSIPHIVFFKDGQLEEKYLKSSDYEILIDRIKDIYK
jgi:thioredoxin 1